MCSRLKKNTYALKTILVSSLVILFSFFVDAQSLGFELNKRSNKGEISFEYINGFIIIELLYNYTFPLNFIFDTGASNTIIHNKEIIDLFSPEYGRTFTVYGADLSQPMYAHLVKGVHFKTDNLEAPNQDILVLEDDYFNLKRLTGMEIHGIIGADMFRNHKVKINYQKRSIEFYGYNANSFKTNGYEEIDIVVQKSKPYINCNTTLSNNSELDLKLLIDTGASTAMLLNTESDSSLELPKQIIPGSLGYGFGGELEGYVGRIPYMEMGNKKLENLVCHFQENDVSLDSLNLIFRHGLIGNFVLDRFEIIIDYPKKKLYLKPTRKWKRKFSFDKSGINFITVGVENDTYYIQSVMKSSPAAQAGLQTGDIIKAINKRSSVILTFDGIKRILRGKTGKKIKIKVKRGEDLLKFEFDLKDLI